MGRLNLLIARSPNENEVYEWMDLLHLCFEEVQPRLKLFKNPRNALHRFIPMLDTVRSSGITLLQVEQGKQCDRTFPDLNPNL